jgi:spore coat protein U-like protein
MYKRTIFCLGVSSILALISIDCANASTATGSFGVSMTIQATCSVQSASDLAFGSQTAITSNLDATGSIVVVCTNSAPYTIGLSAGSGSGASVAARLLTSSATTVPYTIYRDSAHSQVWGVTPNVDTQGGSGTGSAQTYTTYGRIAAVSNPTVGAYADTVSITVTY